MPTKTPITVAHGDGIGPEIMNASLHIIQEAGAAIDIETIEIGEKVYLSGNGLVTQQQVLALIQKVIAAGHDIVKTETLRNYDGKAGYTLAQGQ
jgi:isocitrate/isopropylmalate dehydrogenase